MSNFQDNPSVGGSVNKIDGENETPFKWAYEMDKTQFKYRCLCKKGYHAHGNGGDPHTNRVEYRSSHCPVYRGDHCPVYSGDQDSHHGGDATGLVGI